MREAVEGKELLRRIERTCRQQIDLAGKRGRAEEIRGEVRWRMSSPASNFATWRVKKALRVLATGSVVSA